jgi:myo-inositol-1(or 4)-monophosphatase
MMAMVNVARGALGAFVVNTTHLWDIAAGEVLIKACGGKVTDFAGKPIDYSRLNDPSLVAAKKPLHRRILEIVG